MKKIAIFTFLLCLAAVSFVSAEVLYCPKPNINQIGITVHSSTDFQSVEGIGIQKMTSVGLYAQCLHIWSKLQSHQSINKKERQRHINMQHKFQRRPMTFGGCV